MKHVSTVNNLMPVCRVARIWAMTNSTNRFYDAGRSDRQQRFRESEPSNGQL